MKSLKTNLGIVALLAGASLAFAGAGASQQGTPYGREEDPQGNVTWVDLTGQQQGIDYDCLSSAEVCTARFTEDPNENPDAEPTSEVSGTFVQ